MTGTLVVTISILLIILGIIFLISDYKRSKKINVEVSIKRWKTNSIGIFLVLLGCAMLFKERKYHIDRPSQKIEPRHRQDTFSIGRKIENEHPPKRPFKLSSNLSPAINKLLAAKLKRMIPHARIDYIKLTFSYPTIGFLQSYAGGTLQDYGPGGQIEVESNCGSFQIDSSFIAQFGKNKPSEVKKHLESEEKRIVREHIDQICEKLKSCLL